MKLLKNVNTNNTWTMVTQIEKDGFALFMAVR